MNFEQLYSAHFSDVYRFAVWLARDATQAEDITSETFVRAWAQRSRLRTETLKGYLFTIARNLFLKQRARSDRHERLPEELTDPAPDPHRSTAARLDLYRVHNALNQIPEADRLALVLRTEHALPYEEIARVLEISAGAARVRVHRARRRLLASSMKPNGGESWPSHEK
jgi:RNA polymerase sigma-70 factor (ECF subfamily)